MRRVREVQSELVADDTVGGKPVWGQKFPANRENSREFADSGRNFAPCSCQNPCNVGNLRFEFPTRQNRELNWRNWGRFFEGVAIDRKLCVILRLATA